MAICCVLIKHDYVFSGIDSITINMKEKSMILIGTVDPISAVSKLRKLWPTFLVSVGPAKEPEKKEPKKEEPKKEEPKKEEEKKEEPKKEGEEEKKEEPKKEENKEEPKKDEPKKEDDKKEEAPKEEPKKEEEAPKEEKKRVPQEQFVGTIMPYRPYYPPMHTYYNYHQPPHHHSIEENPNACVIC
ncbi:hypothetical protein HanOQP8_Chr06g0211381 [Helianthus annuus]|nr:hypothetical protein HanOQP8_Chr06g0211381 [Helianthus annuus]